MPTSGVGACVKSARSGRQAKPNIVLRPLRRSRCNRRHYVAHALLDGTPLDPHLIETLPPHPPRSNRLHRVIARSRARHTTPRSIVDAQITAFFSNLPKPKSPQKRKFRRPDG